MAEKSIRDLIQIFIDEEQTKAERILREEECVQKIIEVFTPFLTYISTNIQSSLSSRGFAPDDWEKKEYIKLVFLKTAYVKKENAKNRHGIKVDDRGRYVSETLLALDESGNIFKGKYRGNFSVPLNNFKEWRLELTQINEAELLSLISLDDIVNQLSLKLELALSNTIRNLELTEERLSSLTKIHDILKLNKAKK